MSKKLAETMLQTIPYGSDEWVIQRKKVVKAMASRYDNQYVLCVPGRLEKPDWKIHQHECHVWDTADIHDVFMDSKNFFGKNVKFVKRSTAEYNLEYKQVNVFCHIEDSNGNVALIRKKSGEIHYPGGHVDFTFSAYNSTPEQILRSAIIQELEEELVVNGLDWVSVLPESPEKMFNTNNRWNDLFHLGVIYRIKLNEPFKSGMFKTGEPEKHDVLIYTPDTKISKGDYLHEWVITNSK